jgi:putative redox protein
MAEVKVMVEQVGDSTSKASIRTHHVLIDRPPAKGGTDQGAMGGELMLAGLGGCFMSNLLAAVKARDVNATDLKVELVAELESAPPRFSSIEMKVSGRYTDRMEMEKLIAIAEKACIAANTLRDAVNLETTLI